MTSTDVDKVYIERIKPRLIGGTPTEDIRRWSVLAHSVMEVTGPSPFGEDGNVLLWLHEKSLMQLLDMCDAVDERFSEIEQAATLGSDALAVRLAEKLRGIADEMRNVGASSMKPHELLACYAAEVDKVAYLMKYAATLGSGECELNETESYSNANEVIHVLECSACGDTCEHVNGSYPRCPHCGSKVVNHD